jgi:ribosomal protein S18 acetylase RimI-like enzyme
MFDNKLKNKIITVASLLVAIGVGLYYVIPPESYIHSYDRSPKEKTFILNFFKKNWDWLIPPGSDFSPEYMVATNSSSKEPADHGDTTIKVYLENKEPVGFVAYRKTKFYEGFVNFLGVEESKRRKGYARKLLQHAIDDLKKQGCTVVWLLTRVVNTKAQKLYESMGFKEYERTDYAVYYKKYLDQKN